MFIKLVLIVVIASSVTCKHVPRYTDLDNDDQLLFRAAYDSPPYNHEEYHQDGENPSNKLDLLKDGMWAVKNKIKEMKILNKALAANVLQTKLKLKEFLASHDDTLIKHHHNKIEKKKPVNNYQVSPSSYPTAYTQSVPHHEPVQHYNSAPEYNHEAPQYPTTQYEPAQQYTAPVHNYESPHYPNSQYEPAQQYTAPVQNYEPINYPTPQYPPPKPYTPVYNYEPPNYSTPKYESGQYHTSSVHNYEPPNYSRPQYEPAQQYTPSVPQYGHPQYGIPQHGHDPYYGH